MPPKDKIFTDQQSGKKPFEFNEQVANVFDDMLNRSIPFYQESINILCQVVQKFHAPQKIIYDLGCSTGNTLLTVNEKVPDVQCIGVDNSAAMIEKFNQKIISLQKKNIEVFCEDITKTNFKNCGTVILNYILQFLSLTERKKLVEKIFSSLQTNDIVFISEKIVSSDSKMNDFWVEQYFQFKEQNGYSKLEIARKRAALENVLMPLSLEENITLFSKVGFKKIDVLIKWYNFVSFVAVK